jgi:hypothetical protein
MAVTSKATYLGTTAAGDPWYKGFLRVGFPPIGEGEFWFDRKGFYFSGKAGGAGVAIPTDSILDVMLGRWHARSFSLKGNILKITWNKNGRKVISGFVMDEAQQVRGALITKGWA